MTPPNLAEVLYLHALWLSGAPGGRRADLRDAVLRGADLRGADLSEADLSRAVLSGAYLSRAVLRGAVLSGANLYNANLYNADLYDADISSAVLEGAVLEGAHLEGAHLEGTCLDPDAPVPPISDEQIENAGLEVVGDRLYGWRTYRSTHCGEHRYDQGEHVAPWFSVDVSTECHPGIYFWGKVRAEEWLAQNPQGGWLVRCSALRAECVCAGNKIRAKRIFVGLTEARSASVEPAVDPGREPGPDLAEPPQPE